MNLMNTRNTRKLEQLFASGSICYSANWTDGRKSKGLSTGNIVENDGTAVRVFVRQASESRAANELNGYALHCLSNFETNFPVTVRRADGLLIQERIGKSIFDRAHLLDQRSAGRASTVPISTWRDRHANYSPSLLKHLKNNSQFLSQMEQAHAQRLIYGSFDSRAGNFTVLVQGPVIKVGVIDLGRAFPTSLSIPPAKIPFFKSLQLSPDTLDRINHFKTAVINQWKSVSQAITLSEEQWEAMSYRTDWLLRHKQLPPLEFALSA